MLFVLNIVGTNNARTNYKFDTHTNVYTRKRTEEGVARETCFVTLPMLRWTPRDGSEDTLTAITP